MHPLLDLCESEIRLEVRPPEPPCPEGSQRSLGRRLLRDPTARAPASTAGLRTAPGAITVQARPRTQLFFSRGAITPAREGTSLIAPFCFSRSTDHCISGVKDDWMSGALRRERVVVEGRVRAFGERGLLEACSRDL